MQGRLLSRGQGGAALSLVLAMTAAPVWAQTPPDEGITASAEAAQDEAADSDTDSGIVVTGTRVRRDGFQSSNPLTVLGGQQLELAAPVNIADALNRLPAMGAGLSPRAGNAGTSGGTGGLNVLNLRDLGNTRTLVLLNGRRVAGSTSSGLVNINTIPAQVVERVDIVTGGVSATYGSDAVAGVVNFVLRRDFNGVLGDFQTGVTSQGDGETSKAALSFGTNFADDDGNFLVSAEYNRQDLIPTALDRDWFRGANLVANPDLSGPHFIFADDVNLRSATFGGLITRTAANGPLQGIQFGPGGAPMPFDFGVFSPAGNMMIGGDSNAIGGLSALSAQVENFNVFSRLSIDLTPHITVFGEASYGESEVLNPSVYQFFLGNLVIQQDNAFLPDSVRQQMIDAGLTSVQFGTLNGDAGRLVVDNQVVSYRAMMGTTASLGHGWTLDAYYQYGRTEALNAVHNELISARYRQAIDAISDGAGGVVCRNPANGCVPLNIIGTGVASEEALAWVTGTAQRDSTIEQEVASLTIQGDPFSTWAGPVSTAFGAEYRIESTHEVSDPLSLVSGFFSGNFKPVNGSYEVREAFFEAVVPLARDAPLVRSLEFTGAVRGTEYSTSGYVTTWKAGLVWEPFEDLRIRAVRSRDIRAPNLADLFGVTQTSQTVSNPFLGGLNNQISTLTGGNPDLTPERSDALVIGAVYSPAWLPGFNLSLDLWDFDINGAIVSLAPNAQQAVNLCFQGVASICPLVTFDAGQNVTSVRLAGVNAGTLASDGYDIEAAYRTDLSTVHPGLGDLTVRVLVSRLNSRVLDTGVTRVEAAGEVSGQNGVSAPHWRGQASLIYAQGGLTLGLTGRYVGEGVIDNRFTPADISRNDVPSVSYLDIAASYRFENALARPEFYVAVDNVFDTEPPVVAATSVLDFLNTGANPSLYDVIGTTFRLGVRVEF